ncbi:MAG: hypothetical protein O6941_09580 [Planctomycetota bacterium]|nr:hypothetical protein [Planctomycetota bacterium]
MERTKKMKKMKSHLRVLVIVAVGATAIVLTMGAASRSTIAHEYFVQGRPATVLFTLAGGNPKFDSSIARLDTRTGAVHRFRGNVDNPSVRNTWEQRVAPVKGETSGLLEIQQVRPEKVTNQHDPRPRPLETFLVDIVTGDTWILRRRASTNATWDPVEIYR